MMDKQELLQGCLEVAVPMWINKFKSYSWEELQQVTMEASNVLRDCSEGIIYNIEGKSAKAFNAAARAIAALSFCPGGIEIFGMKWETKQEKEDERAKT